MGISFAVIIVLARRYREVFMTSAMCLATALTARGAPAFRTFGRDTRRPRAVSDVRGRPDGLGLLLFTAGVRLIPAVDAGLITVLEVILAPVWVWLAFGEDPGTRAMTAAQSSSPPLSPIPSSSDGRSAPRVREEGWLSNRLRLISQIPYSTGQGINFDRAGNSNSGSPEMVSGAGTPARGRKRSVSHG
jgi:hypothetical protein